MMIRFLSLAATVLLAFPLHAQIVISGNENKLDLTSGQPRAIDNADPDSISILDFSVYPPNVSHIMDVRNSVIGPPSNIAIAPDGSIALIASSVLADPSAPKNYVPDTVIRLLNLESDPPEVVQEIEAGKQPSGISFTPDGHQALVANRAEGTITVLRIEGTLAAIAQTIEVCKPEQEISDVAISPDGGTAVASVCEGGYLALLRIENGKVLLTDRKFSTCGKPYRCVITPDGQLALTAGSGQGDPDIDALTVVDLTLAPPRTVDYVPIGPSPESIEVSPDGRLVAAVLMAGSNLAPDSPLHTDKGQLTILARRGKTYVKVQELPTGAIPEGVAFSPDGHYIIVQCHPARELWLFEVSGESVRDTGIRIAVPGMPSSLRASTN